jgi:hypothetical protein
MQLIVTINADDAEDGSQLQKIVGGWITSTSGLVLLDDEYEVNVSKVEDAQGHVDQIRMGEKQRIRRLLLSRHQQAAADLIRDEQL